MRLILGLILICMRSSAEELFVFSELPLLKADAVARLGCGSVEALASAAPLSPALIPGGGMVLLVAVAAEPGRAFVLDVGQNPAGALRVRSYRLLPGLEGTLEPIAVPERFTGRILEGQRCALFLVDVEVPRDLAPARLKLEPAVWIAAPDVQEFWIRYPMEVRVVAGSAPSPECAPWQDAVDRIVMRHVPSLLGACVSAMERPVLAERVREARRQQGKNQ